MYTVNRISDYRLAPIGEQTGHVTIQWQSENVITVDATKRFMLPGNNHIKGIANKRQGVKRVGILKPPSPKCRVSVIF